MLFTGEFSVRDDAAHMVGCGRIFLNGSSFHFGASVFCSFGLFLFLCCAVFLFLLRFLDGCCAWLGLLLLMRGFSQHLAGLVGAIGGRTCAVAL